MVKKKPASKKLSIKNEMLAIDKRDFNWYKSLTDDEKKSLSIWVLMRYTSSVQSGVSEIEHHYLTMSNELVNVHFNTLRHYPGIQFRLLQLVGLGSAQFHPWIQPPKTKTSSTKINNKLLGFYAEMHPHLNNTEIEIVILSMSDPEIKGMLEDAGIPKKKIKEYTK